MLSLSCSSVKTPIFEARIAKEWQELNQPSTPQRDEGISYDSGLKHPTKNRYPDVLPYESTRVQLRSSEYINANYITLAPQSRFICAQAPLPNTFNEFWQMIWEHKTPVIVMLTRLLERRRIKGHCYWPSAIGEIEVFGNISVKLISVIEEPNIQIRQFQLFRGEKSHTVWHIHYTEWPDFGVPPTTYSIRRVMDLMEEYRTEYELKCKSEKCPYVVVHCSAGIGRAGTFLAIQGFVEKLKEKVPTSSILIKDIVDEMRKQRMSMVQTKEQYSFIYQVVDDIVIQSGNHLIDRTSFYNGPPQRQSFLAQSHDQFPVHSQRVVV